MFAGSRIRAVVFDLDGTLVETEHLKATAYAELIGDLLGRDSPHPEAIELYRSQVGATDMAICEAMIERFSLESRLEVAPDETLIEALHRQRMELYREHHGTSENLARNAYPHNIELAQTATDDGLAVGVATMSYVDEARRVVEAIGLSSVVKTVVGVDEVAHPKPAPDAFLVAMERLNVRPDQTLIIEDSAKGARAAAASNALWLCVATEFSTGALRRDDAISREWIVWDPADLAEAVSNRIFSRDC